MGKYWVIIATSCSECPPCAIKIVRNAGKNKFIELLNNMNATLIFNINYDVINQSNDESDDESNDESNDKNNLKNEKYTPFLTNLKLNHSIYSVPKERFNKYVTEYTQIVACPSSGGCFLIVDKKTHSIKEILEKIRVLEK